MGEGVIYTKQVWADLSFGPVLLTEMNHGILFCILFPIQCINISIQIHSDMPREKTKQNFNFPWVGNPMEIVLFEDYPRHEQTGN